MKNNNYDSNSKLIDLMNELKVMSQNATVDSVEETAFVQIINNYQNNSDIDDTIAAVEDALYKNRLTISFLKKKISQLIENQVGELAYETVSLALQLNPVDRDLLLLKVKACRITDGYAEALNILDSLKKNASQNEVIEILNEEASIYKLMNNAENTFICLSRVLRLDPTNEAALKEIWWSIEISKNYKESLKLHASIIEHNPYSSRAWYNMGHAHYYLHKYEDAIKAFEYAYIIDEKFELAYRYCAEVCTITGQHEKALKCYYDYMEHFTPDGDSLKNLGVCYEKTGNLLKARKYYLLARNLEPMDDEVYFLLGNTYMTELQWKLAANYFERAISLQDRNEDYYTALAQAYDKCNEQHKADLFFRRATEIGPEIPTPWVKYAEYFISHNKLGDAMEVLIEAEEYTAGAELYYCRSAIQFMLGEKFEAMEDLGEALQLDYEMRSKLFEYIPSLSNDREIKAIIKYYEFG